MADEQTIPDMDLEFGFAGRTVKLPMRLARKAPELLAMLEELEWSGPVLGCYGIYEGRGACPVCEGETVIGGHAPDCRLAALLKEVRGQ